MPGRVFHVGGAPTPFVRLSFASASDDEFDAGMARLASLLRALPGAPATPDKEARAAAAGADGSSTSADEDTP